MWASNLNPQEHPAIVASARILGGVWIALCRNDANDLREWEHAIYNYMNNCQQTEPSDPDYVWHPIRRLPPRPNLDRADAVRLMLSIAEDCASGAYRSWEPDHPFEEHAADHEMIAHWLCLSTCTAFPNLVPGNMWDEDTEKKIAEEVRGARESIGPKKLPRKFVVITLRAFGVSQPDIDIWLKGIQE